MWSARPAGPRSFIRRQGDRLFALFRSTPTAGRILLYHEVGEGSPIQSVSRSRFRDQMRWLAAAGLEGRGAGELIAAGFPSGKVGVTFDDGYASAGEACAQLLADGWSATLYVCPSWLDERRPGLLAWQDLAELSNAGAEIGAHGLAHERLCDGDVRRMADRLTEARERIEQRLGRAVIGLAYPEGLASSAARRAAAMAGYRYACTTLPGQNHVGTDPRRLRRNEVHDTDDRRLLVGKVAGADDWMAPIRAFENDRRCR